MLLRSGDYMDFAIGLLAGISFCSGPMFFLFYGWNKWRKTPTKPPDTDETEKRDMAKIHKDFLKLMNYNEDTARQRKKVT